LSFLWCIKNSLEVHLHSAIFIAHRLQFLFQSIAYRIDGCNFLLDDAINLMQFRDAIANHIWVLNAREILQILCPNCEFSSFGLWKRRLKFHNLIFCSFYSFVKFFKIINDFLNIINNKLYLLSICKILVYFQILRRGVLSQQNLSIQSDVKLLKFNCKSREGTNAHAMCSMRCPSPQFCIYTCNKLQRRISHAICDEHRLA
jgi:hypothetical protein